MFRAIRNLPLRKVRNSFAIGRNGQVGPAGIVGTCGVRTDFLKLFVSRLFRSCGRPSPDERFVFTNRRSKKKVQRRRDDYRVFRTSARFLPPRKRTIKIRIKASPPPPGRPFTRVRDARQYARARSSAAVRGK